MNRYTKYLIIISVVIALLRIAGLYQPVLDIDECAFTEFANKILEGYIPYVDIVDNKPPLTYYFFALVFLIFGKNNLIAVHVVTTLIVIGTALLVFRTATYLRDERSGIVAAIIFTALAHTYEPKYISTSGEILINLPLIISVYLYLKCEMKRSHIPLLIISGISLGIATLINYKAGILAGVFILQSAAIILFRKQGVILKEFFKLTIIGSATLAPIIIIILLFYRQGNLDAFLNWGFLYNFRYIQTGSKTMPLLKPFARTGYFIFCSLPAWILIIVHIKRKGIDYARKIMGQREPLHLLFLIIWLLLSFYAATLGGRTYGHYFIQIIVPLALLSGLAYSDISFAERWRSTFWGFFVILTIIFFATRIDITRTYQLINYPNWHADENYQLVGRYLKEHSSEGSMIYAWGYATPIYYYSNRRCSARFLISDYISGRVFGTPNDSRIIKSELNREAWKNFMDDLHAHPPVYFIDTSPANHYGYGRFPIRNYPELNRFITENYRLETTINKIDIYRRIE
jgi:4-amino-4-deoxy-L-arabinose transferase-like glycosyltransferase